ncbi:hypothetical protein [Actinomadura harenae]|nr:hypothetical protein [Actinomadura harenae]
MRVTVWSRQSGGTTVTSVVALEPVVRATRGTVVVSEYASNRTGKLTLVCPAGILNTSFGTE